MQWNTYACTPTMSVCNAHAGSNSQARRQDAPPLNHDNWQHSTYSKLKRLIDCKRDQLSECRLLKAIHAPQVVTSYANSYVLGTLSKSVFWI